MNGHLLEQPHTSDTSVLKLVEEMKILGMDPLPLLQIAANDIFSRHGRKSLPYAKELLCQMLAEKNPDGIYLWQTLYTILEGYTSDAQITIH